MYFRMKHRIFRAVFPAAALLAVIIAAMPVQARAKENRQMPRLIQTVTEQDIYEGMAALGMLECPVLERVDCAQAYENVKNCVVRIQMGNAHGSGIVWRLAPGHVVVATNGHVLEYWEEADSYVYFPQGYYADARIMGVSAHSDVGFLEVDNGQFTVEELFTLRHAPIDTAVYDGLSQGQAMFSVDTGSEIGEEKYYEAVLQDARRYIPDFDAYMLYGHGFAREGMSGGGTFDGRGYLIGMTTGGTLQNETAGVPLPDIIAAYEEVMRRQENP